MKLLTLLFSASIMSFPTLAAEKVTLTLSPNEVAQVVYALGALNSYTKIVHDARGEEVAKEIPYALGDVRITIAHDARVAADLLTDYQKATQGVSKQEADKLAATPQPLELLTIDVKDLDLAKNPIPANVLVGLSPICPSCVGNK